MVYLFLAPGFEEVEALCPLDLLRRARIEVKTVGVGGEAVTGAHGITVHADMTDSMYYDKAPEMVILPGGMPGTKNLDLSPVVDAALGAAISCGGFIAAICAAPSILGKRGLLKGRRATCYPGFEKYLDGATLSERRVVRDGNIITAASMGVALQFGFELIRALRGEKTVEDLRASTLAD